MRDLLPVETTVLLAVTDQHLYVIDPAFAAPNPRSVSLPSTLSNLLCVPNVDHHHYTIHEQHSGHVKHFSEAPPPLLLARHPLRALDRVVLGFKGQWGRCVRTCVFVVCLLQ